MEHTYDCYLPWVNSNCNVEAKEYYASLHNVFIKSLCTDFRNYGHVLCAHAFLVAVVVLFNLRVSGSSEQ